MLNMILDEWMPWHKELYDFSNIDINRYSTFVSSHALRDLLHISRDTLLAVFRTMCVRHVDLSSD